MRATEIIRVVLDLIDNIDNSQSSQIIPEPEYDELNNVGQDLSRLIDLLKHSYQTYDNSPAPHVSDITSVTVDAGGGLNGPKQPSDLRADSVSLYPGHQHKLGA